MTVDHDTRHPPHFPGQGQAGQHSSAADGAPGCRIQPGLRWLLASPAHLLAFGFGAGLLRPAPGTWGTLLAWILWLALGRLPDAWIALALLTSLAVGVWACHATGRALGQPDHSGMVWDEIVAFWLVLWLSPATLSAQAVAFLLFRGFDIAKPAPIRFFDRRWKHGLGVMWDDLLAAAYALLVMAVLVRSGVF